VLLALALLATVSVLISCSGTGGSGSTSPGSPATQTQATPAPSPAASDTQAKDQETAPRDAADAPELRPENAAGAVRGVPAPTNTVPIVAVANYFTELPGIDVAGLKRGQKEKFLQRVNSEICSCGCKNDTLARCYVNDPRCPLVKTLVQKVYDEVKAGK
jgi:hypothetical protein